MLGLEYGVVKLLPHQEKWKKFFQQEKVLLQNAVGNEVLDIQHIGSTSIPGIFAKPIIDIGIAVKNFEAAAVCIEPIERLGYEYKGEYGIPRRHYFTKGVPRTHHIHAFEIDSCDWKTHILFRDYLIKHPEIAQEYSELKLKLAEQFPNNRDAYLDGKAPFIEGVLKRAQK